MIEVVMPPSRVTEMVKVMNRHQFSDGLCGSCGQPWPCDVKWIKTLIIKSED